MNNELNDRLKLIELEIKSIKESLIENKIIKGSELAQSYLSEIDGYLEGLKLIALSDPEDEEVCGTLSETLNDAKIDIEENLQEYLLNE